jgi:hypothetical protein
VKANLAHFTRALSWRAVLALSALASFALVLEAGRRW